MTKQVKGIILKKHDYRESDRLFIIYTDELGKIEAVAKGIRKIKSKMAGHLDLFSIVDLMVAPGKTYYQIAGADCKKNFSNIKSNLAKTVLASSCIEAVDNFTKPEHPDFKMYKLLEEVLETFDDGKIKNFLKPYGISKFFVLKMMALSGWAPELYTCVNCKNKIFPNGNYFDPMRGGLLCGKCGRGGLPISTAAIKILRFVLQGNLKNAAALKINKANIKEIAKIIDSFMTVRLERDIKSNKWISYLTTSLGI